MIAITMLPRTDRLAFGAGLGVDGVGDPRL
jgi:hypothetical protein